jgi:site-specific DNA recombinase
MARNNLYKPKSTTTTHRIALYIRVSTEEQAENPEGSIRNQEERLRAAVKLQNMDKPFGEIVEVFIDRARSGKDTNRPELQRMLSAIRRNEISLVMVSELSRLSRSIKDFSEIWELMRAANCGFQSLRESFDTTTAAGEMVLYTMANIAQFERKQVSERVSANFHVRAARGLYNGGLLPIGYKLIPERPGFLEIDEESAEVIRVAFDAYLRQETLSKAAHWLNANGYKVKRETQGGNRRPRLGHFTIDNLHHILCNKAYLGIRRYFVKGVPKEAKAVWPAIIDEDTYARVQAQLREHHCRKKPESPNRYPYQLTGIVYCKTCGDRMAGKSAHGRNGKIGYYEHSWATKKQIYGGKACTCQPYRLQAKNLEPAVWEIVSNYLRSPKAAQELLRTAESLHQEKTQSTEVKKAKDKIRSLENQLEVLSERLAQLPKTVSPTPVFKQMEKIEADKSAMQTRLGDLQRLQGGIDATVPFKDYQSLLGALHRLANTPQGSSTRGKIIRTLVRRIDITPEGFKLSFQVGRNYVEGELARLTGSPSTKKNALIGSTSFTNGGPTRTRTWDQAVMSRQL